uniref:Uncharacterized protein n=1 Tax=Micrurus spixii TaxID=129469 RepID=A0A2D4N4W4_9SAUR
MAENGIHFRVTTMWPRDKLFHFSGLTQFAKHCRRLLQLSEVCCKHCVISLKQQNETITHGVIQEEADTRMQIGHRKRGGSFRNHAMQKRDKVIHSALLIRPAQPFGTWKFPIRSRGFI